MMSRLHSLRRLLGAGLLIAAATTTRADTLVTFTVDMNAEGTAIAGGSTVYVRGNFNGQDFSLLPAHILTNDGSGIFSGTVNITNAPGTIVPCKFYYNNPGDVWESGADRQFILADGTQTLPLTAWNEKYPAPPNNITFQVDLTTQITLGNFIPGQSVRVSGSFTDWGTGDGAFVLTNDPALNTVASNIYSQTFPVEGFPGNQVQYKFRANDGWENDPNRSFTIAGGDQVLPLVYYNNVAPSTPTNKVTFQVDMTAQILAGNFSPGEFGQTIRVAGSMYSPAWGMGIDLTNNPALNGNASNVYSVVIDVIGNPGASYEYKFRLNDGYEEPISTSGGNRSFQTIGGPQTLPLVFYSDASPCELLQQPTTVTFVLHLTNGTTAIDGTVYDGSQSVHVNGDFINWNGDSWDITLPQMINNPIGSDFYEHTAVVPAGKALGQKFKFSIGGPDNEAPSFQDHIQYIRTTGDTYTMPVAEFGTNYASVRVEQAFGNLQAGAPVGGNIPITWLGLPCVTLQSRSDLTTGSWTDLPATDATSATNWPNSGSQFFRLQKRSTP